MKFLACLLFASMFALVLSTETDKTKTGEYQLVEKPMDGSNQDLLLRSEYQLELGNDEVQEDSPTEPARIDPYRTCLVVRCVHITRKRLLCVCRVWRK